MDPTHAIRAVRDAKAYFVLGSVTAAREPDDSALHPHSRWYQVCARTCLRVFEQLAPHTIPYGMCASSPLCRLV